MFNLQRFICKIKQSIRQSFRVMIFILALFKDCCFCCEPCSLVLSFLSLSSFFSFEFESFSFVLEKKSSSFLLTFSCFSNSSILRCSSKASFTVVEVLLKLNLTELLEFPAPKKLTTRNAVRDKQTILSPFIEPTN